MPPDIVRALMMTAINTAKSAGASYSDVRIGRYHNSIVFTREQQIGTRPTSITIEPAFARW